MTVTSVDVNIHLKQCHPFNVKYPNLKVLGYMLLSPQSEEGLLAGDKLALCLVVWQAAVWYRNYLSAWLIDTWLVDKAVVPWTLGSELVDS